MLHLTPFITVYCLVLAGLLGACMGSFLNCMAWRIVRGESFLSGRSHCDECGHVLTAGDLVPIVSYLVHRGRCRWCGKKLSSRHLWGEIVSALVFVSVVCKYDVSLQALEYLLWASVLLACSFADLEGYIIPDGLIIAGALLRVPFILLSGAIGRELLFSLIGGILIPGVLLVVVLIFEKLVGREAMGGGDIKLLFVTGLYLGWAKNFLALLLACVLGIVFGLATQKAREKNEDAAIFPFGPSIALAAWLALLFGDAIISAYMGLF